MSASNDAKLLRWGLIFSALLHIILFAFFADFKALAVATSPDPLGDPAIQVTLHQQGAAESMASVLAQQTPSILSIPPEPATDSPSTIRRELAPAQLRPELQKPETSAVSEALAESSEAEGSKGTNAAKDIVPPRPPDPLNVDDLRQYRMNLSREARRYKRYPLIAQERGLEGTAVVVVSTRAGMAIPQVSLSTSSGASTLDAQALEMVALAVRDAKIPEALRNRDFGIDLPIQFLLEDD